jgi:DNA/RNA-binding domain of Phe-tRNA-synthetase-like protein
MRSQSSDVVRPIGVEVDLGSMPLDPYPRSMATASPMTFGHSPEIWRQFPQLVPGVLLVAGVRADVDLGDGLLPWYERARRRSGAGAESELAEIAAWRRAFAQMGFKPTQYRGAAEALLRRFRREGSLPRLHPLVDVCNAVSLAFATPVAVIDLAGVEGDLEVRHARGDEPYLGWDGEVETPEPGEVIYADGANQAHARRWTFRQSRRSTVTPGTRSALIVCEALHATAAADVPRLVDELAGAIGRVWGPPRCQAVLTAASPRIELPLDR